MITIGFHANIYFTKKFTKRFTKEILTAITVERKQKSIPNPGLTSEVINNICLLMDVNNLYYTLENHQKQEFKKTDNLKNVINKAYDVEAAKLINEVVDEFSKMYSYIYSVFKAGMDYSFQFNIYGDKPFVVTNNFKIEDIAGMVHMTRGFLIDSILKEVVKSVINIQEIMEYVSIVDSDE